MPIVVKEYGDCMNGSSGAWGGKDRLILLWWVAGEPTGQSRISAPSVAPQAYGLVEGSEIKNLGL